MHWVSATDATSQVKLLVSSNASILNKDIRLTVKHEHGEFIEL